MDNKELSNTDVSLMMKAALEFNSQVLHIATIFYGNMDSKLAQKSLQKNMKRTIESYNKQLEMILYGNRNTDTST